MQVTYMYVFCILIKVNGITEILFRKYCTVIFFIKFGLIAKEHTNSLIE